MTEQNNEQTPGYGHPEGEDTTRIPTVPTASTPSSPYDAPPAPGAGDAAAGRQHAYPYGASYAPGHQPGVQHGPPQGPPLGPQQPGPFGFTNQPERPRNRVGGGLVAGVLVGALLIGGPSGIAGAAGFKLIDDQVGGNGSGAVTTSTVVKGGKNTAAVDGSVEKVANSVLPSVVKINVANAQESGSGSGIILSSDGVILTNNHVAQVAGQNGTMTVNFNDGSSAKATIVGTDPTTDLAVIKAHGVSGLTPATIDTANNLDVGEEVVAIGSPFGLEATVTSGIVSALNRPVSVGTEAGSSTDTTYPAIQTDAAINPGNSGGPLVNGAGEVVGINSSIRTASDSTGQGGSIGLGFAIPISKVWPIVQELRAGHTATHARLGVSVTDASSDSGLLTGAGVEQVNPGSAAAKAGLQKGDVVTKVGNDVVTSSEGLVATVRGHRPGDKITVTYVRNGKTETADVTLDSDGGSANS